MMNESSTNDFIQVKVVGVGEIGCNSLKHMIGHDIQASDFIAINPEVNSLLTSIISIDICEQQVDESNSTILEAIGLSDIVFVITSPKNKIDSRLSSLVVSCAKELGAMTIVIVDGAIICEKVNNIEIMKELADAVVVINKEKISDDDIFEYNNNTDIDYFGKVVSQAIKGIVELIVKPGLIDLDFNDVRNILQGNGMAAIGIGTGVGEKAAIIAATNAVSSQLCSEDIKTAKKLLVNVIGSEENISMFEVVEATNTIQEMIPSATNIIWGATVDNNLIDTVKVTIIASDFEI